MERFDQIIRLWPEPSAATLARDIGRPQSRVRAWRFRDSIPAEAWPDIVAAAVDRRIAGVTYEVLAAIARRKTGAPARPVEAGAEKGGVPANA